MSVPGLVSAALGDEPVAATVDLQGDDTLYVSPTRTLIYRAEGLLSDESIDEYPHDAERVSIVNGRRKSKIELDYGLDGTKSISVPKNTLDDVLLPVLAGVLSAAGVTEAGERVLETFRFSELTIVVTSNRVVKHIGEAVWDEEFEEFPFEHVTDLDFEEGSVATQVVITCNGRQERFKAPNQEARAITECLQGAMFEYYDVDSLAALREHIQPTEEADATESGGGITFDAVEPLSTGTPAVQESEAAAEHLSNTPATEPTDSFADAGFEPAAASDDAAIIDRLDALGQQIDRQTELLEHHQRTLQQLIEELKRIR